jgi:hypothetical protein
VAKIAENKKDIIIMVFFEEVYCTKLNDTTYNNKKSHYKSNGSSSKLLKLKLVNSPLN